MAWKRPDGARQAGTRAMADMLALSTHLPEVELQACQVLVHEGQSAGAMWVLVSGTLQVMKGDVVVNTITQPGALVGEISVLLHAPYGATVQALQHTVLRHAADGAALLAHHPDITRLVAMGLAERLNSVTAYLVDLKHQYDGAPGLAMVADVLREVSQRPPPVARSGSRRDPDPEY